MARKTILTLALAGVTALTAVPVLAQNRPAVPDCTADPAACQAMVDRMAQGMERMGRASGAEDRGWRRDRGDDDRRGKHERRGDRGHGDRGKSAWQSGMLQRFDADGDGTVSAEEVSAGIAALLAQHDADGDQALTIEEFSALHAEMMKPMAARAFGMLDTNADGRVDAAEADAVAKRMARGRMAPAGAAGTAPAGDGAAAAAPTTDGATPQAPAAAPATDGATPEAPATPAN